MNAFDQKLKEFGQYPLKAKDMSALIVIMGHKCNLRCTHCYVDGSPDSPGEMPLSTINKILDLLSKNSRITAIDISGGSPELNPHFKYFVKSCVAMGKHVMVASNLAVFSEPGLEDLPEFLAENKIMINASLPHYLEENFDKLRGKGIFQKVITELIKLNELGYGKEDDSLILNILYNPPGTMISPERESLEKVFREKLGETYGISFNSLFSINNIPIGRMRKSIADEELNKYLKVLEENFNPETIDNMMCRTSISYDFDGIKAYDCDFWRLLNMPIKGEYSNIDNFNYTELSNREIITDPLCFVCTAGKGLSCGDLLS